MTEHTTNRMPPAQKQTFLNTYRGPMLVVLGLVVLVVCVLLYNAEGLGEKERAQEAVAIGKAADWLLRFQSSATAAETPRECAKQYAQYAQELESIRKELPAGSEADQTLKRFGGKLSAVSADCFSFNVESASVFQREEDRRHPERKPMTALANWRSSNDRFLGQLKQEAGTVGQKLNGLIVVAGQSSNGVTKPYPMPSPTNPGYVVKAGDSLTSIARAHKVTVRAIREANDLRSDKLHAGQELTLPAGASH
jgi:LysM repeat protein